MENVNDSNTLTKEKVQQMTRNFCFKGFYEKEAHIATILITPFDVSIVTSDPKENEYKWHIDIEEDLNNLMNMMYRPKCQVLGFECTSIEENEVFPKELAPIIINDEYERIITDDMLSVAKLICTIVDIIGKNKGFETVGWEELKSYHKLESKGSIDNIKKRVDIIGIPIKEFIKMLQDQLSELEKKVKTTQTYKTTDDSR